VAVKEKGWKGRILVLLFSIAGTVAVMVFYGLVGVAISLFAFNR
jgi:hypothetical protein